MKRFNTLVTGLVSGIVLPAVALLVFYLIKYPDAGLSLFFRSFYKMGVLTHVISLSVIPDLLLFWFFINRNYLKAARGVLLATFLFAFTVLVIRFM